MSPASPHPQPSRGPILFTRFLSPESRAALTRHDAWIWIASFRKPPVEPVRDPEIEAYLSHEENLHRPGHRRAMLYLEGETPYGFNGTLYPRSAGTVMLFDAGESSQHHVHSKQVCTSGQALWVHLRKHTPSLTYEIRGNRSRPLHPTSVRSGPIVAHINEAWDQCVATPGDELCWLYLKSLWMSLFLEILGTAIPPVLPDRHREVVLSIREYIEHHYREPLKLEKLAALAGYSPSFFHQLFKRHAGVSPQEYLSRVRLRKAEELLMANYTVEAITEQIGMASAAYFRRFFKRRMRRTPASWRRLQQGTRRATES
ncbi:MAG TPA: AraC family transcriptional regulator [Chthoniobacteraceae bacterium]|nr:AraC family transcriptional regulator [Chthoniobacteraceae bacterium]